MPAKRCVVCHNGLITNDAIVRDMAIGHDPVIVTDDRLTDVLGRATADRAELTNRIAIADR